MRSKKLILELKILSLWTNKYVIVIFFILYFAECIKAQDVYQEFNKYRISLRTPCSLSKEYQDNSFAAISDCNDELYQLYISELPIKISNDPSLRKQAVEVFLDNAMRQFDFVTKTTFKGLNARVAPCNIEGNDGKVLYFLKDDWAFMFVVLTKRKANLNSRFEKWTQSVKFQ